MKKWISFSVLAVILIVVLILILALVLEVPAAYAHGARGFFPGICVGSIFGFLFSRSIDAQPAYVPPPPPPPRTCYRQIPQHWEQYWSPDGSLMRELVPMHWEAVPCR
jgi:hypothetical protein